MSHRSARCVESPPVLTGGESTLQGPEYVPNRTVLVDWVSVVFPMSAVQTVEPFVQSVLRLFDGTITEFRSRSSGLHGYRYCVASDIGGVLIAWGGERTADTLFLQLPGDACARVACWTTLREFIRHHAGHLTRLDLALDSFDGKLSLESAVDAYRLGLFNAGGRPPKAKQVGNWLDPHDKDGRTLYIGKRENGKCLCVYEKGKEQGDESSPWVRWEVRLSNVDRVLPLDALTDPLSYWRGSYKLFRDIAPDAEATRIPTRKALERIALDKLSRHAREAYGPLLNVLVRSGATAVEVIDRLQREGVPRRLSAPTAEELIDRGNRLVSELINEELSWHSE